MQPNTKTNRILKTGEKTRTEDTDSQKVHGKIVIIIYYEKDENQNNNAILSNYL